MPIKRRMKLQRDAGPILGDRFIEDMSMEGSIVRQNVTQDGFLATSNLLNVDKIAAGRSDTWMNRKRRFHNLNLSSVVRSHRITDAHRDGLDPPHRATGRIVTCTTAKDVGACMELPSSGMDFEASCELNNKMPDTVSRAQTSELICSFFDQSQSSIAPYQEDASTLESPKKSIGPGSGDHQLSLVVRNHTGKLQETRSSHLNRVSQYDNLSPSKADTFSNPRPADKLTAASCRYLSSMYGRDNRRNVSREHKAFSSRSLRCREHEKLVLVARKRTLTPISRTSEINKTSTIVTVELTVNAKISLETHFSSLLLGHTTARSLRRRALESYFETYGIAEQRRQIERCSWAKHESDHLRQNRVLRGKSINTTKNVAMSIAGYEYIKTIGKGSFGVVRLVIAKTWPASCPPCGRLSSLPRPDNGPFRREHLYPRTVFQSSSQLTNELPEVPGSSLNNEHHRQVYAMKVIRKSAMLRNCQEGHLRAERDFLVASEKSQWVVPLIASFQDQTNLYLVMEYMAGGDFLGLLFRKDRLLEKHARWYLAEMILCVEETHRMKWIHRDIKPDNFLISTTGHLKISDFGLAFDGHWAHDQRYFKKHRSSLMDKLGIEIRGDLEDQAESKKSKTSSKLADILLGHGGNTSQVGQADGPNECEPILQWRDRRCKRRMAASIVGTSQYMAPEVIRGDFYDGRCDWWSLGIILYECLYGFTPFICENRERTKEKILDNAVSMSFPDTRDPDGRETMSIAAIDLMNSLLQEREYRLSCKDYKSNDTQHAQQSASNPFRRHANILAHDYSGHFVYPDDARDIKAHPFFDNITWDRLHLTRPPFVPDIKSNEDTKYFDDATNEISNSSSDTESDIRKPEPTVTHVMEPRVTQVDGALTQYSTDMTQLPKTSRHGHILTLAKGKIGKDRTRKRARDRVLRDQDVGGIALELRKKGAFAGYTYRRPQFLLWDLEGRYHLSS